MGGVFEPKIVTLMYECNILLPRVQFWTTSRLASIPTLFPYRLFSSGEENTCYVQNLPLWLTWLLASTISTTYHTYYSCSCASVNIAFLNFEYLLNPSGFVNISAMFSSDITYLYFRSRRSFKYCSAISICLMRDVELLFVSTLSVLWLSTNTVGRSFSAISFRGQVAKIHQFSNSMSDCSIFSFRSRRSYWTLLPCLVL